MINQSTRFKSQAICGMLSLLFLLAVGCASSSDKPQGDQPADAAGNEMDLGGGGADAAGTGDAAGGTEKSLFERVGGKQFFTQFSNRFVDSLAADPKITKNPKVAQAMKGDLSGFKTGFAEYLCQVSGGPCKYNGKAMKEAHKGLGITNDEWLQMGHNVMIKILKEMNVPKNERIELSNLVSMTKNDIVNQ